MMRKTKSRRKIQVTLITLARGLTLCPRGRTIMSDTEQNRLQEAHENGQAWSRWGPYLSERQWGTVREDYSPGGTAWDFLPHDQARSHTYRWGEDGLLGMSDDQQQLCLLPRTQLAEQPKQLLLHRLPRERTTSTICMRPIEPYVTMTSYSSQSVTESVVGSVKKLRRFRSTFVSPRYEISDAAPGTRR